MTPLVHKLLLRLGLATLLMAAIAAGSVLTQTPDLRAFAEDGDDGGDDGGSGGASSSDGGGSGYDAPRPSKRSIGRKLRRSTSASRKAVARGELPNRAANEIITLRLSPEAREALVLRGYVVVEEANVAALAAPMLRLRVPRGTSLESARSDIAALDSAALADFNHFYRTDAQESCDQAHCATWQLISWPAGDRRNSQCLGELRLGMIDTAVNARHEALVGQKLDIIGTSGERQSNSSAQHGTAVAALLIGSARSRTPGLLPEARLTAIDPFERVGGDERSDAFAIIKALDLLSNQNVSVINLSLSGPANAVLEKLVVRVNELNIIVVAAAGNAGPNAAPVYPAAYPSVIAVTAVDKAKRIYRRSIQGSHIDFAAPGVGVWTAASVSGGKTKTGTSFAAPFVSAAAALAKSGNRMLSAAEIVDALAARAIDLGATGKDPAFGHGLIQAGDYCIADRVAE